jgi:hypothetical protein
VVISAGGDRPAVGVPQQLPVLPSMLLPGMLDEVGHQGGETRLPAERLAFLRSRIRHWSGSRSSGRSASATSPRQVVSVWSPQRKVSSSGSSPVAAAVSLISAGRASGSARWVDGRRRGLAT